MDHITLAGAHVRLNTLRAALDSFINYFIILKYSVCLAGTDGGKVCPKGDGEF